MYYLTGALRSWESISNEYCDYYREFPGWGKEFITPLDPCNFIATNNDIAVVSFNKSCHISVYIGSIIYYDLELKMIDISSLKLIESSLNDLARGIRSQYLNGGVDHRLRLTMPLIKEDDCCLDFNEIPF